MMRAAAALRRQVLGALLLYLVASAHLQAGAARVRLATYEQRQVVRAGEAKARPSVPGQHAHAAPRVVLFTVCVEGALLLGGREVRPGPGGAPAELRGLEGAARLNCGRRLHAEGLRVFAASGRCPAGGGVTELQASLELDRDEAEDAAYWGDSCRFEVVPEARRGGGGGGAAAEPLTGAAGEPVSFSAPLRRVATRRASDFHRLAVRPPAEDVAAAAAAAASSLLETGASAPPRYQQAAGAASPGRGRGRTVPAPGTDEFFRRGASLPRASLRSAAVRVDPMVEPGQSESARDFVSMIQIAHRSRGMASSKSRMIWELVVKPLIELLKKWMHCALEHLVAGLMIALMVPMLVDAVASFTAKKSPPPAEPDTKAPPADDPKDYRKPPGAGAGAGEGEAKGEAKGGEAKGGGDKAAQARAAEAALFLQMAVTDRHGLRAAARAREEGLGGAGTSAAAGTLATARVRSLMVSQARETLGLSERAMDLARFQAALDEAHAERAQFVTQPLLDELVPKLRDSVEEALADQAQIMMEKALGQDLIKRMQDETTRTVTRQTTRALMTELTLELTQSVVVTTASQLERNLKEDGTRDLARSLVPELTYAVSSVAAKALTRPPENDFYCHYCKHRGIYCDDCRGGMIAEYYLDVYSHYYARYYEGYFTPYYAQYYSKILTNEMGAGENWGGAREPRPRVADCLDPTSSTCKSARNTPDQESLTEGKPG